MASKKRSKSKAPPSPPSAAKAPEQPLETLEELERLTPKQEAFVTAYMGNARGNGTQAARMAGYTGDDNTLAAIASENLTKPGIQRAIAAMRGKVRSRAIATVAECQEMLTAIVRDDDALADIALTVQGTLVIDPRKITQEHVAYFREHEQWPPNADIYFKPRATRADRARAAMDLLKAKGALIDNVQLKVEGGFGALLPKLQKYMKPESFADLLEAAQKLAAELSAA